MRLIESSKMEERRYGGYKQRQAQAQAALPGSALAEALLAEWVWGRIPSGVVQRLAKATLQDLDACQVTATGKSHKILQDLQGLAAVGATGSKAGNLYRDLNMKMTPSLWPSAYKVSVPMAHGEKQIWKDIGILLPHEVFASIFLNYKDTWEKAICPGEEVVEEFWRSQEGNPQFVQHPLFAHGPPRKTIPLTLHGDGIPTTAVGKTWGKSTDVVSWTSLLASRGCKTLETNFLVWLMYSNLYVKDFALSTTRAVWRVVSWSFKCLQEGVWPLVDHLGQPFAPDSLAATNAGRPLAEGWRAVLVSLKGDLDWFQKMLGLLRVGATSPCCFCPCTTLDNDLPWSDLREIAGWRARVYDHAKIINHVLFEGLPGLNLLAVKVDYMHTKHLGTDSYLCG